MFLSLTLSSLVPTPYFFSSQYYCNALFGCIKLCTCEELYYGYLYIYVLVLLSKIFQTFKTHNWLVLFCFIITKILFYRNKNLKNRLHYEGLCRYLPIFFLFSIRENCPEIYSLSFPVFVSNSRSVLH